MNAIAEGTSPTLRLSISGMRCAGCVESVETALRGVPGVVEATVNFADHSAKVEGDVDPEVLKKMLDEAGYPAAIMEELEDPNEQEANEEAHARELLKKAAVAASLGAPLMILDHLGYLPHLGGTRMVPFGWWAPTLHSRACAMAMAVLFARLRISLRPAHWIATSRLP